MHWKKGGVPNSLVGTVWIEIVSLNWILLSKCYIGWRFVHGLFSFSCWHPCLLNSGRKVTTVSLAGQQSSFSRLRNDPERRLKRGLWKNLHFNAPLYSLYSCKWNLLPQEKYADGKKKGMQLQKCKWRCNLKSNSNLLPQEKYGRMEGESFLSLVTASTKN
jgi:hypothetical protein